MKQSRVFTRLYQRWWKLSDRGCIVGKQSDVGEMGSALLAASQQAAQVAAFHQRNAAWSESVNVRNWNHPSRAPETAQAGRSPSSASSRFGQGSNWSKYFSPVPPLGPPQPESPARSPSQSTTHSSMHTSPIASPQASPHSSMHASPAGTLPLRGHAGGQPEFPPTPSLAEEAPATAGTSSPEVAPHHLPLQHQQASLATSNIGIAFEGPASQQSAAFAESRLSAGGPTAPHASPPAYSGQADTQGEPASPRLPAFAEQELSPRRSRGSDTAQQNSPPLPMQPHLQHGTDRRNLDRHEPAIGRAYDRPGTPESQLSEQTPVRNAYAPAPEPKQAEFSSAQPPASQDSGPRMATQDRAPRDHSESRSMEAAAPDEGSPAEPFAFPASREDGSRPQTDELGAGTLAGSEDEKMEVPSEGSRDWFPREDEKIEVPREKHSEHSAVKRPHPQPVAEDSQPEANG